MSGGSFTSLDGQDSSGVRAEVKVEFGVGTVQSVNELSGTNTKIAFGVPQLKHPVYGYLDKVRSKDVYEYLVAAEKSGAEVAYRIESQRKPHIDRTIPHADLSHTTDAVRLIASVDGIFTDEAVTNPKEDTAGGKHSALTNPVETVAASGGATSITALEALATARQHALGAGVVDVLAAQALTQGASPEEVATAGMVFSEDTPPTPDTPVTNAVAVEARPWISHNTDGRINLGSYHVAHASTIERCVANTQPDADPLENALLAREILKIADTVQTVVYGGGQPNRGASSYTRVLQIMVDEIATLGLPASTEDYVEFAETLGYATAVRLHNTAQIAFNEYPKQVTFTETDFTPVPMSDTDMRQELTLRLRAAASATGVTDANVLKAWFGHILGGVPFEDISTEDYTNIVERVENLPVEELAAEMLAGEPAAS